MTNPESQSDPLPLSEILPGVLEQIHERGNLTPLEQARLALINETNNPHADPAEIARLQDQVLEEEKQTGH